MLMELGKMKIRFWGIVEIIKRELGIISKDFDLIVMLLLAPLFYSLLYASFYYNKMETEVPLGILDYDRSEISKDFIRDLDASQFLKITDQVNNINDVKDDLYNEKVQGFIIIPKDFEASFKTNKGSEIKLYLNNERFLPSNDINKAVNEVVLNYSKKSRLKILALNGINSKQANQIVEPINDDIKFLYNPSTTYGDFLIPVIMILVLQQTLFMGLGESIAKERELNTLSNWYTTSNRSTIAALTGKGLLYFIVYFSYALFFAAIEFKIFKINFAGSYLLLLVVTVIFLIAMISMTIFIASFFKRKILALQIISFTSYPIFFLTGYSWPDFAMPKSMQMLASLLPSTPFFDIYSRIITTGAKLVDIKSAVLHLIILAMIGMILSFVRMKTLFSKAL